MIGFYDYTVVVTYISFISAICGMFCVIEGNLPFAVFCLAFSGFCDMFDGKIARTKKNRTAEEKAFGIQLDSICDIVCFGVLPIILGYKLGMNKPYSIVILAFYGIAGVIRLAYFNVMEEKRQKETSENRKYYQGLPITSMAIVMPMLFVVSVFFPGFHYFVACVHLAMLVVGFLFIFDFRVRKPSNKELVVLVSVVAIAVLFILFYKEGWWRTHSVFQAWKGVGV